MEELERKQGIVEKSEKLQELLLDRWIEKLESGDISPTEAAALGKFLQQKGMLVIDKTELPTDLKGMLTKQVDPEDLDDGDVIPLQRKQA